MVSCCIDCYRVFFVFALYLTVNVHIVLVFIVIFLPDQPLCLVIVFKEFLPLMMHWNGYRWNLLLLFIGLEHISIVFVHIFVLMLDLMLVLM